MSGIFGMLALLVIGFVLLVKGADFFVDGAADIAQKAKVPGFLIGMTVVAMGTSAPECAVTITASLRGANGMAISNVVGSNAFNLLVVCGACALFSPLLIKKETLRREFPFSIFATVMLLCFAGTGGGVSQLEGVRLLGLFVIFLIWMVRRAKAAIAAGEDLEIEEIKALSPLRCLLYVVGGIAAIVGGGQLVVNGAEALAAACGMSETLIGLTICSIGTSLPELVTSVVAARKHQAAMAMGNVIGSNIFNVLLVAGLATAISPISVTGNNLIDMVFVLLISLYLVALVWKSQYLKRFGGISMLVIYGAYLVYICLRDGSGLL